VDVSREWFGLFGTLTSGLIRLERPGRGSSGRIGPPDVDQQADQHQSDQEKLVKQDVGYHDKASFPDGERRLFYRIDSHWNYPLIPGTPPGKRDLISYRYDEQVRAVQMGEHDPCSTFKRVNGSPTP
jgi:hypothetical protein